MAIEGEDVSKLLAFENLEEEEKEVKAELRRNMLDEDSHFDEPNIEDEPPKDLDDGDYYPYPTGINENTMSSMGNGVQTRGLDFSGIEKRTAEFERGKLRPVVNTYNLPLRFLNLTFNIIAKVIGWVLPHGKQVNSYLTTFFLLTTHSKRENIIREKRAPNMQRLKARKVRKASKRKAQSRKKRTQRRRSSLNFNLTLPRE